MKLIKTASGKKTIKMSKKEWQSIGKKAGWMKKALYSDSGLPEDTNISQKDDLSRHIQHDLYMALLTSKNIKGLDHNALLELESKLQELAEWIVAQY